MPLNRAFLEAEAGGFQVQGPSGLHTRYNKQAPHPKHTHSLKMSYILYTIYAMLRMLNTGWGERKHQVVHEVEVSEMREIQSRKEEDGHATTRKPR